MRSLGQGIASIGGGIQVGATACASRVLATAWVLIALGSALACGAAPADAATAGPTTLAPLPESSYSVAPACSTPAPGYASCLALELRARTAAARADRHPIGVTRHFASAAQAAKACELAPAAEGCDGLRPEDLRDAYFREEAADAPATEPQTVALIDAYNDYGAEEELEVFDKEFGLGSLPTCGTGSGEKDCFERVNASGETATSQLPFPHDEAELEEAEDVCLTTRSKETASERRARKEACEDAVEAGGWGVEMATDIEVTRSVCQNCRILLVEATSAAYSALEKAEERGVELGATEISNSWGGEPPGGSGSAFDHPGIVVAAAAGDDGYRDWTDAAKIEAERNECRDEGGTTSECDAITYYSAGADFPASSPDVVAVGGTKLKLAGGSRESETVWNDDPDPDGGNLGVGGGGCSTSLAVPLWQQAVSDWPDVGCGSYRAVADVAADADPYTGVAVYDSMPDLRLEEGEDEEEIVRAPLYWWPIGGTSVASPIIASLYALAGGAQGAEYPARTLYSHLGEESLYDVKSGGNGKCDGKYLGCSGSLSSTLDCGATALICKASAGYDGPTGVGAPNRLAAFERSATAEEELQQAELEIPEREARVAEEKLIAELEQRKHEEEQAAREEAKREEEQEKREAEEARRKEEQQANEKVTLEEERRKEAKTLEEVHDHEQAQNEAIAEERRKAQDHSLELEEALRREEARVKESSGKSSGEHSKATRPRIISLALTKAAAKAVRRAGVRTGQIAFSFDLSAASRVEAKLELRVAADGHARWQVVRDGSIGFSAAQGSAKHSFTAAPKLAPGRYRIVLETQAGVSRSIAFSAG
jgi:hypothetical protein